MFNVQSPRTDDGAIEQEIRAKGLTAPRVTPQDIEANIASEHFFTAAQGLAGVAVCAEDADSVPMLSTNSPLHLLTFCVLVLKNGFTVTGESACASPENFDAEIGRKIARQNAVNKIWPLMGYALKEKLSQPDSPRPYVAADVLKLHTRTDPLGLRVDFVASMSDGDTIKGSISEEEATADMRVATAAILKECNRLAGRQA